LRVQVLRFSRNFGAHETTVAGLREAQGDIAVIMASDLQDPPEVIPKFLEQWRAGKHIAWGVRAGRQDSWLRRVAAYAYYWCIRRLALPSYPRRGTGSFCLITRPVIDAYNSFDERNRVTFELLVWCGFTYAEVPYDRPVRERGTQNWTLSRNIKSALDSILALSYAPIQLMAGFGFIVAFFSFLCGLYIFIYGTLHSFHAPGWASLMVCVLFLGGVQILCLGFLGEYLWRILQECRRRPLYVIRDRLGCSEKLTAKDQHSLSHNCDGATMHACESDGGHGQ
jgi:dolichol-phosphate mannosyltransferase